MGVRQILLRNEAENHSRYSNTDARYYASVTLHIWHAEILREDDEVCLRFQCSVKGV